MKKNFRQGFKNFFGSIGHAFADAFTEVKNYIYANRRQLFLTGSICFILGLVSLLITDSETIVRKSSYILGIIPRMILFTLFALPSFLFKKRRTAFTISEAIAFEWVTFTRFSSPAIPLTVGIVALCVALCFLFFEEKWPHEVRNRDKKVKTLLWIGYFICLLYAVEAIHRFSIFKPFVFAFQHPDVFILNFMTLACIGAFIFIVRRRTFAATMYALVWVILSYISYLKCSTLNEPLLFLDVLQIRDAIPAAFNFLSVFQLILIGLGIVALVFAIVFFIKKGKKIKYSSVRAIVASAAFVLSALIILGLNLIRFSYTPSKFLKVVFTENGMPYSFVTFNVSSFQKKPKYYKEDTAASVVETVNASYDISKDGCAAKNIIVVQVESFCDPALAAADYPEITFERDPMPYMHSLIENYSSGKAYVPVIGGQTVKSEFEFLTGLNMDNLPYGYNPYVAYLFRQSSDSTVRYLEDLGYSSTAIHPYQGEFFNRNLVYEHLGFDRYIPYEFMPDAEKRESKIWGNDMVLTNHVRDILDSTEGGDFVFAVTVQLHGKYIPIPANEYCMNIGGVENEEFLGALQYYVSELEGEDKAIESFIKMLEDRGEPTVVLFYADHLPSLYTDFANLSEEDKFTVQFWAWDNIGLEKKADSEHELFELPDFFFRDMLGMSGPFMTRFRTLYKEKDTYESLSKMVEYYKLYDEEKEKYDEENNLVMGLEKIVLTEITEDTDDSNDISYVIHGKNLTDNTHIVINGKVYDLEFVDSETCYLENYKNQITINDTVFLRIIGEKYGTVFAESNYIGKPPEEDDE